MTHFSLSLAASVVAGLLVAAAAPQPVMAQSGNPAPSMQAADFEEDQLSAFAEAQLAIERIDSSYRERLQDVTDQQRSQRLRQQAMREMADAVRETGLTVEQYNEIATAAVRDQSLADEIDKIKSRGQ